MVQMRVRASRPDPEREKASSGSGPVKTWKMSPEEMEDHFARTADKREAAPVKKGIDIPIRNAKSVIQSESSSNGQPKTEVAAKKEPHKPKEINRDEVIKLIAKGYSYTKIEQKLEIPPSTLPYRLNKWGIPKLKQDGALQLLGIKPDNPETEDKINSKATTQDGYKLKYEALLAEHNLLSANNAELMEAHRMATAANSKHIERIKELEADIAKWHADDNETQELILEIMSERDQLKKLNKKLEYELLERTEDRDNWRSTADELKAKLEPTMCVEVGPNPLGTIADMVNHPDHYKVGGIETIDFIRAKLTPAEFEGYCKGNVLKYVARASHKGGIEDLRKAGKYIEFAVGS